MENAPTSYDEEVRETGRLAVDQVSTGTEQALERIRKRLLDLTNRNPLLNYHHPKRSCLRIVNVNLGLVFQSLLDEQKLPFSCIPDAQESNTSTTPGSSSTDSNSKSSADPRYLIGDRLRRPGLLEASREAGWDVSYDLSRENSKHKPLCVLQCREDLEHSIRLIESKARAVIEESGTNMLYLAFGFLEWYESEDSDESHLAPLVMLPVRLERSRGTKFGTLEYAGEQLECNECLAERLSRDFRLDLPPFEQEKKLEAYFEGLQDVLDARPRWKLRRYLTLAFLSFTKVLMYRDLDPARWPNDSLRRHPRVRELFEGTSHGDPQYGKEYMIDAPELKGRVPPIILDADSSQHSALVDATEGKNLVIEGPPGTGKSQTITNLIANSIAAGKRVLFVAEKLAALEVVRKRLDDVGLGIFCLELHSHRTQKQGLMRDIEERLRLKGHFSEPPEINTKINLLSEKKDRLIKYVKLINDTQVPFGETIFDILWAREHALQELPAPPSLLSGIKLPIAAACTKEDFIRIEQFLDIYVKHLNAVSLPGTTIKNHPWSWVANASLDFEGETRLLELVGSIPGLAEDARQSLWSLGKACGLEMDPNLESLRQAGRILESLKPIETELVPSLVYPCLDSETREEISFLVRRIKEEAEIRIKGFELSVYVNLHAIKDPSLLSTYADILSSAGFWQRMFGADYKRAKRTFLGIARKKLRRRDMAAKLYALADYHRQISKYSEAVNLESILHSKAPETAKEIGRGLTDIVDCWNGFLALLRGDNTTREDLEAALSDLSKRTRLVQNSVKNGELIESLGLPPATMRWLACEAFHQRLQDLEANLESLSEHTLLNQCAEVVKISGASTDTTWNGGALNEIISRCASLAEHREDLGRWLQYLALREQAKEKGISELCDLAHEGKISPKDLIPCTKFAFYNCLSHSIFAQRPGLSEYSGLTLEEIRNQFVSLDKELMQLRRRQYASNVDSLDVPYGIRTGPVGAWTDLALLKHEVSKQKRHIPIRKLVERAGDALMRLKPCFMMSPLSVAQYLPPGRLSFDLVVMDEASQLRPQDSIGAIARGDQLVVVGDPKQLPPTDFFQRLDLEDGNATDDELAVIEQGESILDVAIGVYQPARRLRWHYRSRHESLIAFSSREFYQGDLIVFPTPFPKREDLGVRYFEVRRPLYENRRNVPEAQMVVDAIKNHMRNCANESLGVVTLNLEQKELIEELIEKQLTDDPAVQAYQEKFAKGLERFFVKNLENVQGDERDVIFISCTYGPDASGNQNRRFGPINSENGWRRLNVLFTRAKKRIEVFSSLDPGKIQLDTGASIGVRALKNYLEYAKTGKPEFAIEGRREPDSDFEVSVARVLAEKGYDVRSQVGVAGFFIDLAVINPNAPGEYLTGIECDGATYHSACSVRDRDRLRQEILQNLGWRIYRIWSTDWFRSRDRETKRLIDYIESLIAQCPGEKEKRAKEHQAGLLRRRLIELREKEIRRVFPDADPARSLLRDAMIDELVRTMPIDRNQWFERIPFRLRDSTAPDQVGRFLERVLEIIRDCR